jgi:hypothetical protein
LKSGVTEFLKFRDHGYLSPNVRYRESSRPGKIPAT